MVGNLGNRGKYTKPKLKLRNKSEQSEPPDGEVMLLTLDLYDTEYSIETDSDEHTAEELKEMFSRLLVVAGFPPSVIDEDDVKYLYVDGNETVVKTCDGTDSGNIGA